MIDCLIKISFLTKMSFIKNGSGVSYSTQSRPSLPFPHVFFHSQPTQAAPALHWNSNHRQIEKIKVNKEGYERPQFSISYRLLFLLLKIMVSFFSLVGWIQIIVFYNIQGYGSRFMAENFLHLCWMIFLFIALICSSFLSTLCFFFCQLFSIYSRNEEGGKKTNFIYLLY